MFIRVDAGAVLAEQRVNLAATNGELDAVVGDDSGEPLDDPPHLDRRRGTVVVPDRHAAANSPLRRERVAGGRESASAALPPIDPLRPNYAVGVAIASSATGSKDASSSSSAGTVIVPSMIACS